MKKYFLIAVFMLLAVWLWSEWSACEGPAGGYVRGMKQRGTKVFAATGGGMLYSADNGSNWSFRNNNLGSYDTKSLTIVDSCLLISGDEGVYRSMDWGESWNTAGLALQNIYVKSLINCNGTIFAGTYLSGIYRSIDAGESWAAVNNGIENAKYIYWLESDGEYVYAGTYLDGIYRTDDLGETWQAINTGLSSTDIMAVHIFGDQIFLSTLNQGVFVSDNQGNSWSALNTSIPSVKGFYHSGDVLYAASFGHGVYKSTDGGNSWSICNDGLSETSIWAITGENETVFVGVTSGHIYRSDNACASWELVNENISWQAPVGSITATENRLVAGTHGSGLYTSDDLGATWIRRNSINTVEIRDVYYNGSYVLAGTDMLGIYASNNNGTTFNQSNNGLGSAWIQAFSYFSNTYFAGSREAGIFFFEAGTGPWTPAGNGIPSPNITALANDLNSLYASTTEGVYRSDDLGSSWQQIFNDPACLDVFCLQTAQDIVMAAARGNGVFVSNDQGSSFFRALESYDIRSLLYFENMFFAGSQNGQVFASANLGNSWQFLSSGLNTSPVLSLCGFDQYIWAGMNDGLWKMPLEEISFYDYGDIDSNDTVDSYDAALALQHVVAVNNPLFPLPWQEWRLITADVDNDQIVSAYDASLIMRFALEMIDQFPVQP